jgi:hypothetical protein
MNKKKPKPPSWLKNTHECKVSSSKAVGKGVAEFITTWTDSKGIRPSGTLLVGRADGTGTPRVVTASTREATPGEKDYAKAEIEKGLAPNDVYKVIAVSVDTDFYSKMSNDQIGYVDAVFKKAGFCARARYIPTAMGSLIVAALVLVAALATGIGAVVNGITKPTSPLWVVAIIAGLIFVAAVGTFWLTVRDKTKAPS